MKIRIVTGDCWEGMYIDGQLVTEGHSVTAFDALSIVQSYQEIHCKMTVEEVVITIADQDWLEDRGGLPDRLDHVKEAVL